MIDKGFESIKVKLLIDELHKRWMKRSELARYIGDSAVNSFLVRTTVLYLLAEDRINGITHFKIITDNDYKGEE